MNEDPKPLEGETVFVDPAEVVIDLEGPVMLRDREGVFAHSFKCQQCRLEFVVFSWIRHRHRADAVYCPECGTVTPKLHWSVVISDSTEYRAKPDAPEIADYVPMPNSELLSDSSFR